MIAWLHPAALIGLLALAGPILVHLLGRHHGRRVPFPSLRFVPRTRAAAVRMRLPSDGWLLALRLGLIGAAAAALAQPMLVSTSRQEAWSARLARAIVVDTSASMRPLAAQAREAAQAEAQGVFRSVRIEADDLERGIRRGLAALERLPPARREIVVLSDFHLGAIGAPALGEIPADVGVRFVPVGQGRAADEFDGETLVGSPEVPARTQAIRVVDERTALTLRPSPAGTAGLRLIAPPAQADDVSALLRSVARVGAPAPSVDEPVSILFAGAPPPAAARPIDQAWMLRTILRMRRDPSLAAAAAGSESTSAPAVPAATSIVRGLKGTPLVTAAAAGRDLVLGVAAPPSAFLAAAAVRSVLEARRGGAEWIEREVARIPSSRLALWSRPPGDVPRRSWRHAAPGDARWLWLAALALLLAETFVRRRTRSARDREAHADAA